MMTVHKLSADDGYTYYTREVASADELRRDGRELGDYYTVDGNPPGQWIGAGIEHLGVSGEVTEAQMAALYGQGVHPNAATMLEAGASWKGVKLGQKYRVSNPKENVLSGRIATRMGDFQRLQHREPDVDERRLIRTKAAGEYFRELHGRNAKDKEELGRFMTAQQKPAAKAVAGYDLVFAPAKSASVLWAAGGQDTRKAVEAAHTEAIDEALAHFEATGLYTRKGRNGVRQIDVKGGLIATRFRHYDSRTGDPHLHDHVVVSNKVLGVDGTWGTIDGQQLHKLGVEISEFYNQRVMEKVADRLGAALTERKVRGDRPVVEIAGVDVDAIDAASSRRASIGETLDRLVDEFTEQHGYPPSAKHRIALAQQATLETRPAKKHARRLSELVTGWTNDFNGRGLATGEDLLGRVRAARSEAEHEVIPAESINVSETAEQIIARLERNRSYWGAHHVRAEARRQLRSQMGAAAIPEALIREVTDTALGTHSLKTFHTPDQGAAPVLTRADGSSVYTKANTESYTSAGVLYSQDRLLAAAQTEVIPPAGVEAFERARALQERQLDVGQLALARSFACGDKLLMVGIGAAGTGKTTSLRLAADTIRKAGGRVIGVTPTAAAAKVMSGELGATADTIDSFVLRHESQSPDRIKLRPGDVIFVDEAGMVGTRMFSAVVSIAEQHGAVVRALGDERQLSAVGAGGALRLIKNEVGAVHLEDLHRFINPDEAAATLALREPPAHCKDDPWAFYRQNKRIVAGNKETLLSMVFQAWQADTNAGKNSIMMAADNESVTELNARAQAYRITTGDLTEGASSQLRDGLNAHTGDVVVTRRNERRMELNGGKDFVKNNDVWTVEKVHPDGALTVQHTLHQGRTVLPVEYVRAETMLGYASTVHRTQGVTADTTHAMLTSSLQRSLAYVAASRGREDNRLYIALEDGETMDGVLAAIAARHDTNLTIQEQMTLERAETRSLAEMSARYRDLDLEANRLRVAGMACRVLGDTTAGPMTRSESWAAVAIHLREAERAGYDGPAFLKAACVEAGLTGSEDPAAVLAWRLENRLDRGLQAAEEATDRPLRHISDAHLARLDTIAQNRLDAAQHAAAHDVIPRWTQRTHGHLTDALLQQRLDSLTPTPDLDGAGVQAGEPGEAKIQWLARTLQKEAEIRAAMSDDAREVEAFERDAHTSRKHDTVDTDRVSQSQTVLSRIRAEQRTRELLPDHQPTTAAPDAVPEWMAPAASYTTEGTPELYARELTTRRADMDREMTRRGYELATTKPAWMEQLGPIPSDLLKQQQWVRLAAEVDTYRARYNLSDSEPTAVPTKYRALETGERLAAAVTAMHKHTQLTTKPEASKPDVEHQAEAAEARSIVAAGRTEAEHVTDALRAARAEKTTLSPKEARAQRIAAMAGKLKDLKNRRQGSENSAKPAVSEAMEKIRRARQEDEERAANARQDIDVDGPDRQGPTIGR
ncbi:MobF family relaxase [Arthrobacter tumbae]|uniref:MobF family relaxase n=1 Tax=Arthrobacter tumbae TaxID=163874 RepID=UPI00195C72D1|nr:MobF family relaxase [Arthrobacter tumbae]MBM7781871.1 conjugative relaxase-like TrwC/TraI family protein [Arthrobacter tumbae]